MKQITYNDYLATSSGDGSVKIWNPFNNWQLIRSYTGHGSNWVYALEYLNSDSMASGSVDRTIKIWSIITGQTSRTINTGSEVFSLKLLSNGFYLAAGLGDFKIHIFNINTGSLITTLNGHTGRVRDLVLIGNLLASSSEDKTIRIWDLATYTTKFVLNGHSLSSVCLKVIDPDTLVSGSSDATIKLWNVTSGALMRTLSNHTGEIYESLDLLSDGQTLVSGSKDETIKYWNTRTGQMLNSKIIEFGIWSLATLKSTRSSEFYRKTILK